MWVRFEQDYDWRQPAFTIAYKAGMTLNVTRACADAAMAAGKAVRMRKAGRDGEAVEVAIQPAIERLVDGWVTHEKDGPPVFLTSVPEAPDDGP